eukprot:1651594-Rhodomonas_salina.4
MDARWPPCRAHSFSASFQFLRPSGTKKHLLPPLTVQREQLGHVPSYPGGGERALAGELPSDAGHVIGKHASSRNINRDRDRDRGTGTGGQGQQEQRQRRLQRRCGCGCTTNTDTTIIIITTTNQHHQDSRSNRPGAQRQEVLPGSLTELGGHGVAERPPGQ